MERRVILATILSMAVIFFYMKMVAPDAKKQRPHGTPRVEKPGKKPPKVAISRDGEEPGGQMDVVESVTVDEKLSTICTQELQLSFCAKGGALCKGVLRRSQVVKKGPIELIRPLDYSLRPGALRIKGDEQLSEKVIYEEVAADNGTRTYRAEAGALEVEKRYTVRKKIPVVHTEVMLRNNGKVSLSLDEGITIAAGALFELQKGRGSRYLGADVMSVDGEITRLGSRHLAKGSTIEGELEWVALRNQFFAIILKPETPVAGCSIHAIKDNKGLQGVKAFLHVDKQTMAAGETMPLRYDLFIGPKEKEALEAFGTGEVFDLGWFGFLGEWILKGLKLLYAFTGNYGIAIILLTILIRLILFPFNNKSFKSMKHMQQIQPKIAALNEKYKDDPKKKQQELIKLYKEHGVNPAGGCLPLLLQMPILIAFFRVLQNSVELWGAPFFLWIKDLSEPDALLTFSTGEKTLPFIGTVVEGEPSILLNVLPLCMLAVFFIQQRMSSTSMAASPEQKQQQKIMMMVMPVMFGVIFYNMPSGLNLYFTISTLLGIIQQKYMIK